MATYFNEIPLMGYIYKENIKELAERIVNESPDKIETDSSFGKKLPDVDPIIKSVNTSILEMCYDDLIKIIMVTPSYIKQKDRKRGVFIDDYFLNDLFSCDNDNVKYAIDTIKEAFVEQHKHAVEEIIEDVESIVEELATNLWYEMGDIEEEA